MKDMKEIVEAVKKQAIEDCERMALTMDDQVMNSTLEELDQSPAALLKFQQTCLSLAMVAKDIQQYRETMFEAVMMAAQFVASRKFTEGNK